jgi:hypothetical protein
VSILIPNENTIIKYEEHVISKCVSEFKFVNPVNTPSTIIEALCERWVVPAPLVTGSKY